MTQLNSSLAKQLISIFEKANVVQYGTFTLKDGSTSSVYIDLRLLPNFPKEFQEVIDIAANYIRNSDEITDFDGIIAPPLAGVPLGVALSLKLNKEFYLARQKPKEHGRKKIIEGDISNKNILMIDDVISSGGSKTPLLNEIRSHNAKVESLFVFINRMSNEEELREFEKQNHVRISYLLSLENLINPSSL